jgi:hypothetical protein
MRNGFFSSGILASLSLASAVAGAETARTDLHGVEKLRLPSPGDTLWRARLSPRQRTAIIAQVQATSFDTPANWKTELLAKQAQLGSERLLIVRGSKLLCGATANCQTWLFRWTGTRWMNAIEGKPPIVSSLRLQMSRGAYELIGCSNVSATHDECARWKLVKGEFRGGPSPRRTRG